MADFCEALAQYDKYLAVCLERHINTPEKSTSSRIDSENFRSAKMLGRRTYAKPMASRSSSIQSRKAFREFYRWLSKEQYIDDPEGLAALMDDPDLRILYPDDPSKRLSRHFVVDRSTPVMQQITDARDRTGVMIGNVKDAKIYRLQQEQARREMEDRKLEEERALAAENRSVMSTAIPRALMKPSMRLGRVSPNIDMWDIDLLNDDYASTYYLEKSIAEFQDAYGHTLSPGDLFASAYKAFMHDITYSDACLKIADSINTPFLDPSENDDEQRHSVCPYTAPFTYRMWTWGVGASLRDQRVELALLEHFSFLAAIAWLVWNPVDKRLLSTLIKDANKHAHGVLQESLKLHYVDFSSKEIKHAKKTIGKLLHSKKHGIIAKAMEKKDRDDDGYLDGWIFGLCGSNQPGTESFDDRYFSSFNRRTLIPLGKAIDTATHMVRRDDRSGSESDSDSDDEEEEQQDTRVILANISDLGRKSKKGGTVYCASSPRTMTCDDLVYRVNSDHRDQERPISGYIVEYSDADEERHRLDRARAILTNDMRERIFSGEFVPNAFGSMAPHMNLSRRNFYSIANMIMNDHHLVDVVSSDEHRAESLFMAIAYYCARRDIDWSLVGHVSDTIEDNMDDHALAILKGEDRLDDDGSNDNAINFTTLQEYICTTALCTFHSNCITTAAHDIVDSIYPISGSPERDNNRLIGVVVESDVYIRESKAGSNVARCVGLVNINNASNIIKQYLLGSIMYNLVKKCAPFSKARVVAAIRLIQEGHASRAMRHATCSTIFKIRADDLFKSLSIVTPISVSDEHISKAISIYKHSMEQCRLVAEHDRFQNVFYDPTANYYATALGRGDVSKSVAKLLAFNAESGSLIEFHHRAKCCMIMCAIMKQIEDDVGESTLMEKNVATRIAMLPVIIDRESVAQFCCKNIESLAKMARAFSEHPNSFSIDDIRTAVALSGADKRICLFAACYAIMCQLVPECDTSKQYAELAYDIASSAVSANDLAVDGQIDCKYLSNCANHCPVVRRSDEVIEVFSNVGSDSASADIIALSNAIQLIHFLSKDTDYSSSRSPFVGAFKEAHANGEFSMRISATRDHLTGSSGFQRTITVNIEQCRRAANLCRFLLPLIKTGVEMACSARHESVGHMTPFITAADVIATSDRFLEKRYMDASTPLNGIVHRHHTRACAHLAAISAEIIGSIFSQLNGAQEPESAFVVRCSALSRYPIECIEATRFYLDYLVRRWAEFEMALELMAIHKRIKSLRPDGSKKLYIKKYTEHPLTKFVNQHGNGVVNKNHYRFVRLLYEKVADRDVIGGYAWLVPPDADVVQFLGESYTIDDVRNLIARCCMPPSLCNYNICPDNWDEWRARYNSCAFTDIGHHRKYPVPVPGDFYRLKRIPPALPEFMRKQIDSRLSNSGGALIIVDHVRDDDIDDSISTDRIVEAASSSSSE
jgi:hypothetical protein